jgi:spermidine synthase
VDHSGGGDPVSRRIEELDWRETPMGAISLRRRMEPTLHVDVYEVLLGDEYLMSSLFTVAEVELARLGLAAVNGEQLDVVVGGLGLGYTARTALEDERVRTLQVVEALPEVIGWHEQGLLPDAGPLTTDPRCRLVQGDFFALVAAGTGFSADGPSRLHAVLLDVDHTPQHLLHPSHAPFYTAAGLQPLVELLHPGGVFALWSDAPPDEGFLEVLHQVFATSAAHVVTFANHLTGGQSANTVYVASVPA